VAKINALTLLVYSPVMKNLLLSAALSALCLTVYSQAEILDSLKRELKNHPQQDSMRVKLLVRCSYFSFTSPDDTREYAQQALDLATKLNYVRGIGGAHSMLATFYHEAANYQKALDHTLRARKAYEQINDLQGIYNTINQAAGVYMSTKDYKKCEALLDELIEMGKKNEKLIDYANLYHNLGVVHCNLKKFESGIDYHKKSLDLRIKSDNKYGEAISYHDLGQAYAEYGKYSISSEYYIKCIELATPMKNPIILGAAEVGLGENLIHDRKLKEAEPHLAEALRYASQVKNQNTLIKIYQNYADLYEIRKNYKATLEYERKERAIKDSLFNEENTRNLAEIENRFEAEKKEGTIQLLENEKRYQALWQRVLIASLVAGVIVFAIVFLLQRSRNRKARELLAVQTTLNAKLEEVDHMKSKFFANISHEFRTPLTLILAPLDDKLRGTDLKPAERDLFYVMRRSAKRLLELVNQLLDLSKLEAGKMKLTVRHGDITQFFKVVAASFDSLAQHKGINFIKDIQSLLPDAWFDDDKLEKIINNLLSNAFKFTPMNGTVTMHVNEIDRKLVIAVSDTGAGIPENEQEEVFSPFYQTNKSREANAEGTGLGLPLVKELVKLYSGSVQLRSKENAGTTVTVSIPLHKNAFADEHIIEEPIRTWSTDNFNVAPTNDETEEEQAIDTTKDSILIVEDNNDLRQFMINNLQQDYHVLSASNGEEALTIAMTNVPNIVLSDLMMPVMDGMKLTKELKGDERTSHIPVILLTAKNEPESRIEGLNTGADDYLTKPFSNDELKARISNLIRQRKLLADKYKERVVVLASEKVSESLEEKFLQKALRSVEQNLDDPSFSVVKMAEDIGLSRTQLLRKLKALTGISPNEFIKDIRLQRAAELIRQKADTVTQIGYRVGFNDQSYFTKCFKKKFGVSPSEYHG
jgi:signal transduction histidine kinase/DNA-binding response OmpR family regulator